ncbi:magnesium transporter CorA family protein [Geminicoccaceae bacterium 1502E]|nr:magnesium transporter CorA family protein [Geminicoccaceae bacterium 1502E]
MLLSFERASRELRPVDPAAGSALAEDVVWVDVHEPDAAEAAFVERWLGAELPTREEMREIEASARVYEEHAVLFMTSTLLVDADTPQPRRSEVTFILKDEKLVTLRYADPQPFKNAPQRLERQGRWLTSGQAAFFWLVDGIIARLADILERATADTEALSRDIFRAAARERGVARPDLTEAMGRIGRNGDTASTIRECLHTLQRVLFAVGTSEVLPAARRKEVRSRAKILQRDVASLTDHAGFLTQKVNLLLDATLGLINIEQNAIIKIFSVAAVVFLPPTLIASIYGMNFAHMPELGLRFGYPLALALMVVSAILPYVYFKRRGWL